MPKILGTEEEKGPSLCVSTREIIEKESERMGEQCLALQPTGVLSVMAGSLDQRQESSQDIVPRKTVDSELRSS
jgi:hypothetical protein